MVGREKLVQFSVVIVILVNIAWAEDRMIKPLELEMFADELPDMPRIKGFDFADTSPIPTKLSIGMYHKLWKFHRDLPATPVFAYGTTKENATVPGPTIEALHGVHTHIKWTNYLPSKHILPWDPTIPTATPHKGKGIPTVVHVHGGVDEPESDGHSGAWFTARFKDHGPSWTRETYNYHNLQHPGTLWYHDHAMGLTRVNLLAGLVGAYIIRQPSLELPLGLPYDEEFDRPLVVFDRSFSTDGSIYMDPKGNNPSIHPQWQPEYFGDAIVVNGKAWPYMTVRRRKYRFRIINASNARFFNFSFDNGLKFILVGSDSAYIEKPVTVNSFLLAPSEIADVVVDFSKSKSKSVLLTNDAAYPYPSGDPVNAANSKVMKFIIKSKHEFDTSKIPKTLIKYPLPSLSATGVLVRYISLYEYTSPIDEPTHLYINGLPYEAPATETPKVGTTEIWNVINLTEDNHPLHIHLGLFMVLDQTELVDVDEFKECMLKYNDAIKCGVHRYATGRKRQVPAHERGWKNVFKLMPGHVTKIFVRFSYIHSNESYPFDATAEPGYVYHCHILDHEDNAMMRPLKFTH
ncbi:multicopper oxidase LPR1-like [Salvia hispanica]|uniref:multicopper oxidase LPR1-like n=1 Tax=Salvia hispanica TaxID=49212 RepID=UPI00200988F0|nr:multicopper oxidase LPR1-like [Salvia hispanica]